MQQFSKSANQYDKHAYIQKYAADILCNSLPNKQPATILELGAGTGLLTALLRQKYPKSYITAIDSSEEMLGYCQHADQKEVIAIENYSMQADLTVSSMAMQWVNKPEKEIEKYNNFYGIFVLKDSFTEWGYPEARAHLPRLEQFSEIPLKKQLIQKIVTYSNKKEFLHNLKYTGASQADSNYKPITPKIMRHILADPSPFSVTWKFLLLTSG